MNPFVHAERPLALTTYSDHDKDHDHVDLLLEAVHGRAEISQLYVYRLELLAPIGPAVPFEHYVGRPATVRFNLPDRGSQMIHGIISQFSRGGRDEHSVHYQANLVPKFWLFTHTLQSRIFQGMSVPDIVKAVLDSLRPNVLFHVYGSYPIREFCVQYQESDFDFVNRILEEEGIFYYFQQTDKVEVLVISDGERGFPEIPERTTVVFEQVDPIPNREIRLTHWTKTQAIRAGRVTLHDQHFQFVQPHDGRVFQFLESSRPTPETVTVGAIEHVTRAGYNNGLELYEYPGDFAKPFDEVVRHGPHNPHALNAVQPNADRLAVIRAEQEAILSLRLSGQGNCGHLLPGYLFTLSRHPEDDGVYLVEQVDLKVRMGTARSGTGPVLAEYQVQIGCSPKALRYRPQRRTAKPRIVGTQTATVTAPAGYHVHVDKYGRVKVQFHWDRQGKFNADSSCWVRVSQLWAGGRWGAFFWPRPGHEVVVSFQDGDPDRPMIVGSVYNAASMPPLPLPALASAGGIKSCVLGHDPLSESNCVIFHDRPGNAHVQIHSEQHDFSSAESSRYVRTPGPSMEFSGSFFFMPGSGAGGSGADDTGLAHRFPAADASFTQTSTVFVGGGATDRINPISAPSGEFGSGSGGGVFDVVTAAALINGKIDPDSKFFQAVTNLGSVKFVTGDNYGSTIGGGRTTHVFGGGDVKRVFDLESFAWGEIDFGLGWPLKKAAKAFKLSDTARKVLTGGLSSVLGLCAGVGGATDFIVGAKVAKVYGGPKIDINRCTAYKYDSWIMDGNKTGLVSNKRSPGDTLARSLATVTMLLAIIVDIIATVFEHLITTDPTTKKPTPRFEIIPGISASSAVVFIGAALVSRLHGLLVVVEKFNAISQMGLVDLDDSKELSDSILITLVNVIATERKLFKAWIDKLKSKQKNLEQAVDDLFEDENGDIDLT